MSIPLDASDRAQRRPGSVTADLEAQERKTKNQDIGCKGEICPKMGLNIQSKIYPADEI